MIRPAHPWQAWANASGFVGGTTLALTLVLRSQPRAALAATLLGTALFVTFLALMFRSVRR